MLTGIRPCRFRPCLAEETCHEYGEDICSVSGRNSPAWHRVRQGHPRRRDDIGVGAHRHRDLAGRRSDGRRAHRRQARRIDDQHLGRQQRAGPVQLPARPDGTGPLCDQHPRGRLRAARDVGRSEGRQHAARSPAHEDHAPDEDRDADVERGADHERAGYRRRRRRRLADASTATRCSACSSRTSTRSRCRSSRRACRGTRTTRRRCIRGSVRRKDHCRR